MSLSQRDRLVPSGGRYEQFEDFPHGIRLHKKLGRSTKHSLYTVSKSNRMRVKLVFQVCRDVTKERES